MNEREETLLGMRPLVLWAWLLVCLLTPRLDPDPVAVYLSGACLLFAAARWSATVRRESSMALVLLDAPAVFTLQRQQGWPPALAMAVLSGLVLGSWALRRQKKIVPLPLENQSQGKPALMHQPEVP